MNNLDLLIYFLKQLLKDQGHQIEPFFLQNKLGKFNFIEFFYQFSFSIIIRYYFIDMCIFQLLCLHLDTVFDLLSFENTCFIALYLFYSIGFIEEFMNIVYDELWQFRRWDTQEFWEKSFMLHPIITAFEKCFRKKQRTKQLDRVIKPPKGYGVFCYKRIFGTVS